MRAPVFGSTIVGFFVAVKGASNFAEATATQQSHDWLASHVRLVEFLEGVPRLISS